MTYPTMEMYEALHAEKAELRARIERLEAGWETAFNIGVSEQEQNKKLRAEIERLEAALSDAADALEGTAIAVQELMHDGSEKSGLPSYAAAEIRKHADKVRAALAGKSHT